MGKPGDKKFETKTDEQRRREIIGKPKKNPKK